MQVHQLIAANTILNVYRTFPRNFDIPEQVPRMPKHRPIVSSARKLWYCGIPKLVLAPQSSHPPEEIAQCRSSNVEEAYAKARRESQRSFIVQLVWEVVQVVEYLRTRLRQGLGFVLHAFHFDSTLPHVYSHTEKVHGHLSELQNFDCIRLLQRFVRSAEKGLSSDVFFISSLRRKGTGY
jgi:hypothetical protein